MLFLLVRSPCKIGVQLFTDAFGNEIHRPYFQVDSVNREFFKFCESRRTKDSLLKLGVYGGLHSQKSLVQGYGAP